MLSKKLTTEEHKLLREAGYSDKVIELYKNKVNIGSIINPDVALAYTGSCGDTMKLYLRISESARLKHEDKTKRNLAMTTTFMFFFTQNCYETTSHSITLLLTLIHYVEAYSQKEEYCSIEG